MESEETKKLIRTRVTEWWALALLGIIAAYLAAKVAPAFPALEPSFIKCGILLLLAPSLWLISRYVLGSDGFVMGRRCKVPVASYLTGILFSVFGVSFPLLIFVGALSAPDNLTIMLIGSAICWPVFAYFAFGLGVDKTRAADRALT